MSAFSVLGRNWAFVLVIAVGSMVGSWIGARLHGIVPEAVLLPALAAILLFSAWTIWNHK